LRGSVFGRRATIVLTLRVAPHPDLPIEFVVDTGFAGFLTLPAAAVAALGLPFRQSVPVHLADGSSIMVAVHEAVILWDGVERELEVLATGRQPLLGTSLLDGHDLAIQFRDGGPVTIDPISALPSP
jgi:clan AA aspartic protease